MAQPAVTDLKTLRNRHSSSLGNFGDIVSQGISWDKNALVGHSGGYSLKRLGKKATLDLFYSLCYTVITHSPKSHILSLGNSYKKRAPCSEHDHKYFVLRLQNCGTFCTAAPKLWNQLPDHVRSDHEMLHC